MCLTLGSILEISNPINGLYYIWYSALWHRVTIVKGSVFENCQAVGSHSCQRYWGGKKTPNGNIPTAVSAGLAVASCKIQKKWTEKCLEDQHMLYFCQAGGSRMSNMTFQCVNPIQLGPSPFNSSPQCKKSSLRHHFRRNSWKLGSQKLLAQAHFWCASKISFSPVFTTPMSIFGQKYPAMPHLWHPENAPYWLKWSI